MLDRLFKDIGKQIKNWAKASYVIGIIISLLAGVIFFAANENESITWIGALIMVGGTITISAFSTLLYGFGELIDKTCDNENNTRQILKKLNGETKRKAEKKSNREAKEKNKREMDERTRRAAVEKVRCEVDKTSRNEAEKEQLSISDIEGAASAYLNRPISISDISCTLIYVIPKSSGIPKEMHLDMAVGNEEFTSLDLFFDENRHAYFFEGRHLALDGAWRSEEEIFGFDIALFKSFNTEADEDD